ncbi:MAG TPA: hypothetical protein VGO43_04850 [Pyrinomonadaceae bacterium]|jgi:hypothetical protein|nr:hypothetical protein [Pyrinomonadaceae bacterium]
MKHFKIILGSILLIVAGASAAFAQQQITQTVTAQNKNCNAVCSVIDVPELNNNPAAVVFITPVMVNGANLNPHPVGAYYMYLNKWSVFNLDGVALNVGAKFTVDYYPNPDVDRFVFVIPSRPQASTRAYIDHAGLNNNANLDVRISAHVSSTVGNIWNHNAMKVEYDSAAQKWFIADQNNVPPQENAAYNISFSNKPVNAVTDIAPTPGVSAAPPIASAGGDLSGYYPNPMVVGLRGRPLSNAAPTAGQILKWNGTAWEPADVGPSTAQTATDGPRSYIGSMPTSFTWAPNTPQSEVSIPGLSIQITLTKPSVVNVSAFVPTKTIFNCGALGCSSNARSISLYRNNGQVLEAETLEGTGYYNFVIPNYPESLPAGTYTYQIHAGRVFNTLAITFNGNDMQRFKSYISVQVFPQ